MIKDAVNEMIREQNGSFVVLPFLKLGVIAACSTRKWNLNFRNQEEKKFLESRKDFCQSLEIDVRNLAYFDQVHGREVVNIDPSLAGCGVKRKPENLLKADGGLTKSCGIPIAIFTADCAPVFFFDPVKRAVGIVHAGWRGASSGIIQNTVALFTEQFQSRRSDIQIFIGPLIKLCCYVVGPEFKERFDSYVSKRENQYYFDLNGFIVSELQRNGILPEKIIQSNLCTSCEKNYFFSYRREGIQTGRLASIIMLLPSNK